jgi:hypothetical protein
MDHFLRIDIKGQDASNREPEKGNHEVNVFDDLREIARAARTESSIRYVG